ncbi:Nucleolar protein 12 [Savitreella phatthalungensis]
MDASIEALFAASAGPRSKPTPKLQVTTPLRQSQTQTGDAKLDRITTQTVYAGKDNELSDAAADSDDELAAAALEKTPIKPKSRAAIVAATASAASAKAKKPRKRKRDDVLLEDLYLQRLATEDDVEEPRKKSRNPEPSAVQESALDADTPTTENKNDADDDDDDKSDADSDDGAVTPNTLTHESVDRKDRELEKAKSTIFVGNLPVSVITSSTEYKSFKTLLSGCGKVKSIRFRSIAFSELLPRKVAFVQGKFHPERDTANAYVVYATPSEARSAVTTLDGHHFAGRKHLRVDSVAHPSAHDNRRSVFVGNLDFDAEDESLWLHFGKAGSVEKVRVVRDAKTNVGKGFAYVQFKDAGAVQNALLLDGQKIDKAILQKAVGHLAAGESAKSRKLRVIRASKHGSLHKSEQKKRDKLGGSNGDDGLRPRDKAKLGRVRTQMGTAAASKLRRLQRDAAGALEGHRATEGLRGARKSTSDANAALLKKRKKKSSGSLARSKARASSFRKQQNAKLLAGPSDD